jgi:hypothetical protein
MVKPKTTRMWLVSETGWEYNDEYYYRLDGSHPCKLYKTEQEAAAACIDYNIARFRDYGPLNYAESWDQLTDRPFDELVQEVKRICGKDIQITESLWNCPGFSDEDLLKLNDYQIKDLLKLFNYLTWFEYKAIEVDN